MNEYTLSQHFVAYPVFNIRVTYRYRKVRKPTVFDKLIMSLVMDFPQLKQKSLGEIIQSMQLDEVFIRKTLEDMLEAGLIEDIDLDNDLNNIQIEELILTNHGEKFFKEKKMISRRKSANENFFFNPLINAYEQFHNIKDNQIDIKLDHELFTPNQETLTKLSINKMAELSWVKSDIDLESNGIDNNIDIEQIKWKTAKVSLVLDNNYNVTLRCDDKLFKSWLDNRSLDVIHNKIIKPILDKADNIIEPILNKIKIDNLNNLLSLVLADQNTDLKQLKQTVPINFSNAQEFNNQAPYIILNNNHDEAKLKDQILSISCNQEYEETITKIFWDPCSFNLFYEEIGYIPAYFHHQEIKLPVRILSKNENNQIAELSALNNPNFDTLAFMANYLPYKEIIEKFPKMDILEAISFKEQFEKNWNNKKFITGSPDIWAEKINLLNNNDEIEKFTKLFPNIPLSLSKINDNLHSTLIDEAFKNPKSQIAKTAELSHLFKLTNELSKFNDITRIQLNLINQDTMKKFIEWESIKLEFKRKYPKINSIELDKRTQNITNFYTKINELFEPISPNKKFAVLDTDFIRKYPEKLFNIQKDRIVILSKTTLDELDYQKEKSQKDIYEANKILNSIQTDSLDQEIKDTIEDIENINNKIKEFESQIQNKRSILASLKNHSEKENV
ncbi:PIN domain-containing protein [Neisseria zalophi]|uniref:Uncharacterized protein n=1 Tax=Neisseria zalophi TaxID=640030 RepID=A0A5J6PZQ9_9NEIS|nr:hypothetical protein [Neisseria zalophi]QEY26362.1 hypothetical protein D0T92_07370 [Neisseria zalophi]